MNSPLRNLNATGGAPVGNRGGGRVVDGNAGSGVSETKNRQLSSAAYSSVLWCIWLCWSVFAFVAHTSGGSNPLEFQGIISASRYDGESKLFSITNWYSVVVDETNNRVRTGLDGDANILYNEYGRVGKDSYYMSVLNPNRTAQEYVEVHGDVVKTIKANKPFTPGNSAMLWINDGVVADAGLNFTTPVWLAYSFGGIFKDEGSRKIRLTPIVSVGSRFRELGGKSEVEYKLGAHPPHFLASLTEKLADRSFRELGLQVQFSGYFTNCIFEVTTWTNFQELIIPLRFRLIQNILETMPRRDRIVFEGELTAIKFAEPLQEFSPPKIARVIERRKELVAPFVEYAYTTTDGKLWNKEQIMAKGQPSEGRLRLQDKGNRNGFVFIVFVSTIVTPLLIALLMSIQKHRRSRVV